MERPAWNLLHHCRQSSTTTQLSHCLRDGPGVFSLGSFVVVVVFLCVAVVITAIVVVTTVVAVGVEVFGIAVVLVSPENILS